MSLEGKFMQNKIFIEKIKVEGLFNLFNYDIDCCKNSKVSIFIAPNGCGKSTIFNFLDFISYPSIGNFSKVENVPVKSFCCEYSNGTKVQYKKNFSKVNKKYEKFNFTFSISLKNGAKDENNLFEVIEPFKSNEYFARKRYCEEMMNLVSFHMLPCVHHTRANRLLLDSVVEVFGDIPEDGDAFKKQLQGNSTMEYMNKLIKKAYTQNNEDSEGVKLEKKRREVKQKFYVICLTKYLR